jgi:hypothetical protein
MQTARVCYCDSRSGCIRENDPVCPNGPTATLTADECFATCSDYSCVRMNGCTGEPGRVSRSKAKQAHAERERNARNEYPLHVPMHDAATLERAAQLCGGLTLS